MSSKFIPNSFQVPNVIVDEMMAVLGDTELRCYLTLIRKTTGWQKEMDFISNTQFQKYTGRGKTSITHALQKLQERGLVFELDSKEGTTNCYALNADQFTNWTGSKSELVQKVNGGSSESERVPVQKVNTQNTNTKPTKQKTTTTAPAPVDFAEQQSQATAETGQDDARIVAALFAEQFAMPLDWQPANREMVADRLRLSQIPALDTDLCRDAQLNFAEFWYAQPKTMRTAAEWDAAFLKSVRNYKTNYGHRYHLDGSLKVSGSLKAAAPTTEATQTTQPLSATARSLAYLQTAHQAVKDGTAQIATPSAVFAVVVEGLADLLGQGLKYPPAADAWGFTLQIWDKAFSERNLTAENDVRRVAEAFAAAKQAALNSPEQTFPKPHEVLARLPMRMMPRQLGYTETAEEREQRKAEGREQMQNIKAILSKTGVKA